MPGFLGTKAPVISDIAFLLEITVLIVIFLGRFKFARRKSFMNHGRTMALAVTLHGISILLVMIPSLLFIATSPGQITQLGLAGMILILVHVPIGILVEVLGAFLVSEWRFRPPNTSCRRNARLMKPIFTLWVLSSVLGIAIYAYYYI